MNQNLELKWQAWLDRELSDAETRRTGEKIAGDATATRLVAELRSVKEVMAGNELGMTVPDSRDFYWSKIQREIERQARGARPAPSPVLNAWVRWLSPISGVAALSCILLMATRHPAAPTFDEISSTGEGMEAVTFHDQTAGMTVVWLADTAQSQDQAQTDTQTQMTGTAVDATSSAAATSTPAVIPVAPVTPDPGDTDVEME
jgi:hypothetical protein